MKNIISIVWVAVILMLGLVFIQNQSLYSTNHNLSLNLILFDIALPPLSTGTILLLVFFIGILLSAASSMVGRIKTRKALKRCNASKDGYVDKIGALKSQLDKMNSRHSTKTAS